MVVFSNIEQEILRGMSDHSRVWIYQANRPFSDTELTVLKSQINGFIDDWTAHKKTLLAAGDIFYQQFIVLAVDESMNGASGCSIDASVYFLKSIEHQYNIELFDRMNFAFLADGHVKTGLSAEFSRLYTEGVITNETLMFDNLVKSVGEIRTAWLKPLRNSWHRRFV